MGLLLSLGCQERHSEGLLCDQWDLNDIKEQMWWALLAAGWRPHLQPSSFELLPGGVAMCYSSSQRKNKWKFFWWGFWKNIFFSIKSGRFIWLLLTFFTSCNSFFLLPGHDWKLAAFWNCKVISVKIIL